MAIVDVFPFQSLTDEELQALFAIRSETWLKDSIWKELHDYVSLVSNCESYQKLDFQYFSEDQYNRSIRNVSSYITFSVFHLNIRCLNSKSSGLCQLLNSLDTKFDAIVLSEIWSYNIEYYANLLPEYIFYYDLPEATNVGGVGN